MRDADMQAGIVLNYNEDRGFGFIKPDGACRSDENVFFHHTVYHPSGVIPRVGARVVFSEGTDDRTGRTRAMRVEELGK
jgi:cold shock CspA family protein